MTVLRYMFMLLIVGCTTTRPVSLREVIKKSVDTVVLAPTIINNQETVTETVRGPRAHDTMWIKTETVIERPAAIDTAMIAEYISRYSQQATELVEVKKMLASLQLYFMKYKGQDSQATTLQGKLDTSKKETKQAEKQVEAAKYLIFSIPKIIYLLGLAFIIGSVIYLWLIKRKHTKHANLS